MKTKRKPLKIPRTQAFIKQKGLCYYCQFPMWNKDPSEVLKKYNVSMKNLAHFKCTGEHLIAHSEGGSAKQSNIVAACWYCNSKRHQRKKQPNDIQFQKFVQYRIKLSRWNSGLITEA
jgi:5-methylcytosine-specific restriction endonuclease McrA